MILVIVAALFGAMLFAAVDASGMSGFLFGALAGCVIQIKRMRGRLDELAARVEALTPLPRVEPAAAPRPADDRPAPVVVIAPQPVAETPPAAPRPVPAAAASASAAPREPAPALPPREPNVLDHAYNAAVRYFTTGNLVARVGSVVLFFGLAFLLKYAADRNIIPIEVRLSAVAVTGLALLVTGWRLRARGVYGQILQGTGVGTLYLTTYVAMKVYALVPPSLAFPVLVASVVLSGWLALAQDSRALATLGTLGGFLAPILTSTGEGSHVVLFSYYALLNLGILGVAWRKAWRELNLLGFAFTFVIASVWGYRAYAPSHYATTQPFLAFHWVLYVAISILFAARRTKDGMGFVDGTLVFGVPTAAFALQAAIAADFADGVAYSALAIAAGYLLVSRGLALRGGPSLARLRVAFLAISAAFATLAVPIALKGNALAAAWALEGLALVWIGVRQDVRLQRATGLALQLFAGFAFLADRGGVEGALPVLNGEFVAPVLVALAGIATAYLLASREGVAGSLSQPVSVVALVWGLFWWLSAGINEIQTFVPVANVLAIDTLFLALTAVALDRVARALRWSLGGYPGMALLPALALVLITAMAVPERAIALTPWGAVAWVVALAAHLALLRWREAHWPEAVVRLWHAGGMLLVVLLVARESGWAAQYPLRMKLAGIILAWVALPILAMYILPLTRRLGWPLGRYGTEYGGLGLIPVAMALAAFVVGITLRNDPTPPLPYVPLLHPYELAQAAILVALLRWWTLTRGEPVLRELPPTTGAITVGMIGFLAINGVLARAVHQYGGVPYAAELLFGSRTFQAGMSILWSTLALGLMVTGSKRLVAPLWFGGAGLLGLVVLKLFFVELGGSGTIARVVSFLAVGLLMLLIGYLAPMPPRGEEAGEPAPAPNL